jgi:hypothetical protein
VTQLAIPSAVTAEEIAREQTLGGAIDLCAKVAGLVPKQLQDECSFDKGQYSRWVDGNEGIKWDKLVCLMDTCGNDAPLLWMLNRRGYDLGSVRRKESETERELRTAREEIERLKAERSAERRFVADVLAGRAQ